MLERIFIMILNMSLTSCVVIAAVLLARLLLRKAPHIFSYALWAIVLFRLLCPVSFATELSLLGALQGNSTEQGRMEYIPEDISKGIGYQTGSQTALPPSALEQTANHALTGGDSPESVHPPQIWLYAGSRLWALGVLIILLGNIYSSVKLFQRLRHAQHLRDNLYRIPGGGTPFVCGIMRPRIYFPEKSGAEASDYIVLHEQTHIRRGDHIFRLLACLTLCLHWFNPLVWLAFHISARDMEMSCDEAVLRKAGSGIKKDYSASLLNLSAENGGIRGVPLAFGEKEPESRIKNVLRYKKPAVLLLLLAIIVCAAVAFLLMGNPKPKESASETYYGIVTEQDANIVYVPGFGEIFVPWAETIEPYIEMDFQGLEAGQLLRITFPENEKVGILETYPAQFSTEAKSIEVMGIGFGIQSLDNGKCLFAVPLDMAPDAEAGDTLRIFHSVINEGNLQELYALYALEHPEKIRTELLAEATVSSVDSENYDIWVELSPQQAQTFLSEFGFGISCELDQEQSAQATTPTEPDADGATTPTEQDASDATTPTEQDADDAIETLLEIICSDPASSSNPEDYIDEHPTEYQELISYGQDTLEYCFARFEQGGETGLEGHVMMRACEDIASEWGEEPLAFSLLDMTLTGQMWYDSFKTNALRLMEEYPEDELAESYPASYLLLGMLGEI